jgi:hypothetical protein
MTVVLSWEDRRTRIGKLVLDVLLTEEIDLPSTVTQYPVEDGTIISDHITEGSETVRINGVIATQSAAAFGFTFDSDGSAKMIDVVEALREMHAARSIVAVSSGQMLYEDMAFTSLQASRAAGADGGGNWLSVKAEMIKVRKVQLRTADVPAERVATPANGRAGQTGQQAGRSTPSTANTATNQRPRSALFGATQGGTTLPNFETLRGQLGIGR